jgi:hypothetical protein
MPMVEATTEEDKSGFMRPEDVPKSEYYLNRTVYVFTLSQIASVSTRVISIRVDKYSEVPSDPIPRRNSRPLYY